MAGSPVLWESTPIVGQLMFRYPTKDREFDSGFVVDTSDMRRISPSETLRLRCKVCLEIHEFKWADGRVSEKH